MASFSSPAAMRAYIVERLVGETGEPDKVTAAAQALASSAEPVFADRLRSLLATPLKVELAGVEVGRVEDARAGAEAGQLMVVASLPAAPDSVLMLVDRQALALLVSAMFGGDPGLPAGPIAREPSPIEVEVAATVLAELAEALNAGGPREAGLGLVLPLPSVLAGEAAKKFALRDGPAVRISLRLSAMAESGDITLLVVQRVLLSRRETADAAQAGAWGARIGEEIMRSAIALEAVMPMGSVTLGALGSWEVGAVVPIEAGATENAKLLVRGRMLYLCEFGRLGSHYTVRIREPFEAAESIMDGLLPG